MRLLTDIILHAREYTASNAIDPCTNMLIIYFKTWPVIYINRPCNFKLALAINSQCNLEIEQQSFLTVCMHVVQSGYTKVQK